MSVSTNNPDLGRSIDGVERAFAQLLENGLSAESVAEAMLAAAICNIGNREGKQMLARRLFVLAMSLTPPEALPPQSLN